MAGLVDRFLIEPSGVSPMVAPAHHLDNALRHDVRDAPPRRAGSLDAGLAAEARLVRDRAPELLARAGIERGAVPPRLVAAGTTAAAASALLAGVMVQPVSVVTVDLAGASDAIEVAVRRAMTQTAPRGRTFFTVLSDLIGDLAATEARKLLRILRKSMIRGDALLLGAEDWDSMIAMCAAAGFQLQERWVDDSTGAAIVLFAAD